jgi:hypothetical protein
LTTRAGSTPVSLASKPWRFSGEPVVVDAEPVQDSGLEVSDPLFREHLDPADKSSD